MPRKSFVKEMSLTTLGRWQLISDWMKKLSELNQWNCRDQVSTVTLPAIFLAAEFFAPLWRNVPLFEINTVYDPLNEQTGVSINFISIFHIKSEDDLSLFGVTASTEFQTAKQSSSRWGVVKWCCSAVVDSARVFDLRNSCRNSRKTTHCCSAFWWSTPHNLHTPPLEGTKKNDDKAEQKTKWNLINYFFELFLLKNIRITWTTSFLLFIVFWAAQQTCRHTSDSRRVLARLECSELSVGIM